LRLVKQQERKEVACAESQDDSRYGESLRQWLARLGAVQCRGAEDHRTEEAKVDEGRVDGYLDRYRRKWEGALICSQIIVDRGRKPDVRDLERNVPCG
jgi:hypothetical protein